MKKLGKDKALRAREIKGVISNGIEVEDVSDAFDAVRGLERLRCLFSGTSCKAIFDAALEIADDFVVAARKSDPEIDKSF